MDPLLVALLLLTLALNLAASVLVLRATGLSGGQRARRFALVWLLPVLGAIVCLAGASIRGPRGDARRARGGDGAWIAASDGGGAARAKGHGSHDAHDGSGDGGAGDGGGGGD